MVILTVGAAWRAPYEIYAHTAVAHEVGLSQDAIAALVAGQSTDELTAEDDTARRFAHQLATDHRVDPELYEAAFGRAGLVDLVYLVGMYLFTSAMLNAFEVPAAVQPG